MTSNTQQIIDLLKIKTVNIRFTKSDGSTRLMKATLQPHVLPEKPAHVTVSRAQSDQVIRVWDLEKQAWRSVRLDRIQEIIT